MQGIQGNGDTGIAGLAYYADGLKGGLHVLCNNFEMNLIIQKKLSKTTSIATSTDIFTTAQLDLVF